MCGSGFGGDNIVPSDAHTRTYPSSSRFRSRERCPLTVVSDRPNTRAVERSASRGPFFSPGYWRETGSTPFSSSESRSRFSSGQSECPLSCTTATVGDFDGDRGQTVRFRSTGVDAAVSMRWAGRMSAKVALRTVWPVGLEGAEKGADDGVVGERLTGVDGALLWPRDEERDVDCGTWAASSAKNTGRS